MAVYAQVAYSNRYFGVTIEGTTNSDIQRLMNMAEENTKTYSPDLTIARSNFSFGSDHIPFQRAGIPGEITMQLCAFLALSAHLM